ncbi:hypothetical protein GOV09_04265 [Candidatus Woesearchaeota archaeon]|nr:hypothetical protein [Candidatus Woesearchaeota archaeon]
MRHKTLTLGIISLLILSAFVFAAGTSTETETPEETSTPPGTPPAPPIDVPDKNTRSEGFGYEEKSEEFKSDCDNKITLPLRIRCRLENKVEGEGTPEACASAKNPEACAQLYKNSESCYMNKGKAKDACFRRMAGFARSNLAEQGAHDKEAVRNYLVLLLYDLQERVEKAYEGEKLESDKAAGLISQIVQIKQAVLKETSSSEIKLLMSRFKDQYKGEMQ